MKDVRASADSIESIKNSEVKRKGFFGRGKLTCKSAMKSLRHCPLKFI